MKIRQELIDKLVNSSWTREKLAEEILIARYYSKLHQLEVWWLDQLADMLRDGEGNKEQDRIYKEYQDDKTDHMNTYRDRANES
tara:strand:+ start:981 stop:1232 length:252 start_codon:yes stop_codon:yes gene_type:complete